MSPRVASLVHSALAAGKARMEQWYEPRGSISTRCVSSIGRGVLNFAVDAPE